MERVARKGNKVSYVVRCAFLAALFLLFCWQVVQASWFFNLEYVEVSGNETLSSRQVEEIAGIWKGAQLLKLDTRELEKRLLEDPRVVSASVSRALPNKLRIVIEENIGLAVLPYYDGFVEVDLVGRVVSVVNNFSRVNLPIITGVPLQTVQIGVRVTGPEFEAGHAVAKLIPPSVRATISEINVTAQGEVNITTTSGIHIKFGRIHNASQRLALLPAVLYAYEVRGFSRSSVECIDMSGEIPVYKGR